MVDVAAGLHAARHVLSLATGTDRAPCGVGFVDRACLLFDSDRPDLFRIEARRFGIPQHFRTDGSLHPCLRHDARDERLDPVVSRLSGRRGIKAVTALLSIGTGVAIWKVMPLALALPSAAQLERANQLLGEDIGQRQRAEAALREANAELEQRVAARTADLQDEVVRRRNTEATLRASEERWRSMFEASAVGIAVLDQQHHFAATNEALQKMVGYSGEELQSLGPLDITHQDDREATQKLIEDMRNGKRQDLPTETRYRRKDNKVIWVRVSAARALDSSRSLQGIPAIIEDITERKRAEVAWNDARDALSRATRLTVMGELSASIAHEINQPLAAIITNGQASKRFLGFSPPDLDEVKDAVDEIVRDGRRASEVLKRIRAMSKTPRRNEGRWMSTTRSRKYWRLPATNCSDIASPSKPTCVQSFRPSWLTGSSCSRSFSTWS